MNSLHSSMHGFAVVAISILIMGAFFVFPTFAVPPIDCGGAVPCSCGNRVVEDTVLDVAKDPVVTTICPGDGLIVAPGVKFIDMNGLTITGKRGGDGIILPSNITLSNGIVNNFLSGVKSLEN